MDSLARPIANPLVQTSDFDSDALKPMTLCVVPGAQDPIRFAMPSKYIELVRQFDGERTEQEAIEAFLAANPDGYTASWLHRLVRDSLIPKGLLIRQDQDPSCAGISGAKERSFLFVKFPIIPSFVVDAVAGKLAFMFHRNALLLGLILFVASHLYVYAAIIPHSGVGLDDLDAASILWMMLFSTLGTLCHEFGHASAAAHFGCRRMTIGWGIYIIYTVLWTNVSEAWRLPRRQRAVIDVGGVYFESLFLLVLLACYLCTHNVIFLLSFLFIDLSIARTFNPFIRMDGYWLLSDLLGIVNLRQQQATWYRDILAGLFGRADAVPQSRLSDRAKKVLAIYSVLTAVFFAYILYVVFTVVLLQVAAGLPRMLVMLAANVSAGVSLGAILGGIVEIVWRVLMLLGATTLLLSLAKKALKVAAQVRTIRASARAAIA